ncbi:MAG TPA: DHA2 family efflux MFS transporter permease subunit [Rhizomicrobium sp.]|nr:DHA2 family efflux MFS transporter permease subunit [Rhizomicrobium sp.]
MSATKDAPLQGAALWLTAVMLAMANFIAVLDMTIANVSMASIAGGLGISSSQGTWVITSYSVAEAIVVPLTGWLAGRFGTLKVFTTAMTLFGVFSALCGFSNSLEMLVFGRIMQGLSGGCLMPLSQTLLLRVFPKERAPAAMALWAMTTLVAPVLGPILGGAICDNLSWPFIFFINVPIALGCAPLIARLLKRFESAKVRAPIDVVGLVLLIVFVGALQVMLDIGKDHDWFEAAEIRWLAAIAIIGFLAFLVWELTDNNPVVDLRIFRHRGFTASVFTLSVGYGAMFGANVLTPLWLQSYMGYTPTWAGMATAWSGTTAVLMAPIAGMLMARKLDPRRIVFFGLMWIAAVMLLRTYVTMDVTYWQIAIPLLLMGFGLPMFFVLVTTLALGSVEEHETASGAGLQNFLRTMSGAITTSLVTTAWDDKTTTAHAELAGLADRNGDVVRTLSASGMSHDAAINQLNGMVQSQSVMIATNQLMFVVAIAFAIAACVIWLSPRPSRAIDPAQAGGH